MAERPDQGLVNLRWAWTLVDALAAAGVRHVVISPGSRSTPLALACLRHPHLTAWMRVDERGAAFFALGLARASGSPVAVVATSGSAVANWLPAVVEARHGRVPLLLLSADRPPELHHCGANQTIHQSRLFGEQVNAAEDLPLPEESAALHAALRAAARRAVAASLWPCPGPVHLNQPLREPLLPGSEFVPPPATPVVPAEQPTLTLPALAVATLAAQLGSGPGVIVCGPADYPEGFPAAVAGLARRLAAPLLADPLSGLRGGPAAGQVLARYDGFLRSEAFCAQRPAWVLRFGAFPVSKPLATWLAAAEPRHHWVVDPHGRWPDPLHAADAVLRADPAWLCRALTRRPLAAGPAEWLATFRAGEAQAANVLAHHAPLEAAVVAALMARLPAEATLFVGNSLPVRDVDAYSGTRRRPLRVVGNRGASGIDGNLSTALGLAAAGPSPVVALVGDLTCYHDLNALARAAALPLILVVVNNGGGNIFRQLPQAALPEFQEGWLTPVELDFARVAALFGLRHSRAATPAGFRRALNRALAAPNGQLIEVVVDGAESAARRRAGWEALKNAAPASAVETPVH